MFLTEKWMVYALGAAMLWGASYAASGPVLRSGMTPVVFYFCYSLFGVLAAACMLLFRGEGNLVVSQISGLRAHMGWLLFSLLAAALGGVMTYMAIGEKNATLACLLEISYPMFVVLFTWLFFREVQLNVMTFVGAMLVISGIALILLNER